MLSERFTPYEILEAIHLWHTGEVSVGTLAARLGVPPENLILNLEQNGICDRTGVLVNPDLEQTTVNAVVFMLLVSHHKGLLKHKKEFLDLEGKIKVLRKQQSP